MDKVSVSSTATAIAELERQVKKLTQDNGFLQLDVERLQEDVRELQRSNIRFRE